MKREAGVAAGLDGGFKLKWCSLTRAWARCLAKTSSLLAATAATAMLYDAMRETGIGKSELALRLGVDEKGLRRMRDAGHGTKLPRIVEELGRYLHNALD